MVGVGLSIITVVGDFLIKRASFQSIFKSWGILLLGSLIYGLTGLGWFFVMKNIKLSTVGVLYSVCTVVFLTLVSVIYFKEKISVYEIIGIIMAIISLIILYKFS